MERRRLCEAVCLLICTASIVPVCGQRVRINFQPPGEVPDGYLPDHGEVFGDRGNGYSYGWDADLSDQIFDRHSSSCPDLRYDTVFRFPREVEATWEIALENGVYDLFVVSRDPCSPTRRSRFKVEGCSVSNPSQPSSFNEFSLVVKVSDGRLTINSRSRYPYFDDSPICLVHIMPSTGPRHVFPRHTAENLFNDVSLSWSSDSFYQSYDVYLGETFDDVNEGATPIASGLDVNSFDPGTLEWGKTYHWRVDGIYDADNGGVVKGRISSFQVESFGDSDKARMPYPASGATDISPETVVTWRAGRDASQHVIYVSSDVNEVLAGTTPAMTSDVNSVGLAEFDLLLDETYYWRVDEVDDALATDKIGPVWRFSTSEFLVVDDFERYTNWSPNRIFQTWHDGYGYELLDYFHTTLNCNCSGAALGHDIWSLSSPHFMGLIMETSIVHWGQNSAPMYYNNTGSLNEATYSQVDLPFELPLNWEAHGIQSLVLYFHGGTANTGGSLYVKVNDAKVIYPNDEDLKESVWHQWAIDLTLLNTNLKEVKELSIGVDDPNTEGIIYLDDIRLYRNAPEPVVSADPGAEGLVALYRLENDTIDSSGYGHHGVAVGDPVYQSGVEGTALAFDGTGSQYVDLGTFNPSEGTGQLSVSMWVKRSGRVDAYQGLMGKRDVWSAQDMMWQIELNQNTGTIAFAGHGGQFVSSLSRLRPNEWTHVGVTYDGEMANLFVRGQLSNSSPFTLGPATDAALVLGACGANGENPFHGVIDKVAIYNRNLSSGEMRHLAGDR